MIVTASVLLAENGNRITQESGGGLIREPAQYLASDTGILSFQHTLTLLKGGLFIYLKDLFGSLPSSGSISNSIGKRLSGTLSFVGRILYGPILHSTLSFVGSLPRKTILSAFTSFSRLLTEAGDSITTESGDHLGRLVPVSLSFIGNLVATGGHNLFTLTVTGTLSFIGSVTKQTNKLRTAALSFVGALTKSRNILLSGAVSFIGTISRRLLKLITSALSFVGTFITPHTVTFTSVLSFISRINVHPRNIYVLLQSVLRLRSNFANIWNSVLTFMLLIERVLTDDKIIGRSDFNVRSLTASDADLTITTTPSVLSYGSVSGPPLIVLFIKNLDTTNTIVVDTDNTFDQFPQIIGPGEGIYLAPSSSNPIYAKSLAGSVQVKVIAGI